MTSLEKEGQRAARGSRLKKVREDLHVKQKDFASQLGITQPYLSAVELGKKELTTKLTDKLFELFQVSPNWILKGEGSINRAENVPLNVQEMSPQSKSAVADEALRAQRLEALWVQLINRSGFDYTGIHYAQFASVLGFYSDKMLAHVAAKVEGQINAVLGEVLDDKLPLSEAPEKLKMLNAPMLEMQDLFLGVERAIYTMMEAVTQHFPETKDLLKGSAILSMIAKPGDPDFPTYPTHPTAK